MPIKPADFSAVDEVIGVNGKRYAATRPATVSVTETDDLSLAEGTGPAVVAHTATVAWGSPPKGVDPINALARNDHPGAQNCSPVRRVTCRYLRRGTKGQCTAEAADPDGEILLCPHHLAAALELLRIKGVSL